MTASRKCLGWCLLAGFAAWLGHAHADGREEAEKTFQRYCAELASRKALPDIDGSAWFNGVPFGFKLWQSYVLPLSSFRGRMVIVIFANGRPGESVTRPMGQWWARMKRDALVPMVVSTPVPPQGAVNILQATGIRFPFVIDADNRTARSFGLVDKWPPRPVAFVVQRDGALGAVVYGDHFENRLNRACLRIWGGRDQTEQRDLRVPDDFLRTFSPSRNGTLATTKTMRIDGVALREVLKALCRDASLNLLVDIGDDSPPVFFECREIPLREIFYRLSVEYALTFRWEPSPRVPTAVFVSRESSAATPAHREMPFGKSE